MKPLVTKHTTIDKMAESTVSFHDYLGIIDGEQVEQTLVKSGYLPLDKILTKDDNGMLMCRYIKAIDSSGRTTFVDMDCDGMVSVEPSNMTMTKVSSASVVPYSVKMGAYECANSDVCGVAFECDNEICTLKRSNEDLTPTETVFAQIKEGKGSLSHSYHGMLQNHPIAYPIVSLSDIKNNPEQVACSVRDSHNRMRNIAFGQCARDTRNLNEAAASLGSYSIRDLTP